jgi:hypothetical protein
MAKFSDIQIGVAIVLVVAFIIVIFYTWINEKYFMETHTHILFKDKKYKKKEPRHPPRLTSVCKVVFTGFTRGFLAGYFVGGLEGACVGGLSLALINPIMTIIEHHI